MRYLLTIIIACGLAHGQMLQSITDSSTVAAASNIALVQAVCSTSNCLNGGSASSCKQTGASGAITCAITSTGTGHLLQAIEFDYAANPAAPSLPTDGGDTWLQDCTFNTSAQGRVTYFEFPNSVSGRTSITFTPNTGASSVIFSEWSGITTSSPALDSCMTSPERSASTGTWVTYSLLGTQNDLFITSARQRTNANESMAVGSGWTILGDSPQSSDGDEGFAEYQKNVIKSQLAGIGSGTSTTYETSIVSYKSAVAGTPPSGFFPFMLADGHGGSNGATVSAGTLASSANGGANMTWSCNPSCTGMTFQNAFEPTVKSNMTVAGTTYKSSDAATLGYDWLVSTGTNSIAQAALVSLSTTQSYGCWWQFTGNVDTNTYNFIGMLNGTDRVYAYVKNATGSQNTITMETAGGDSGSSINVSPNTQYWVTGQWVGGGTNSLAVYDSTGAQVGSTLTHAATGTTVPTAFGWGRLGANAGSSAIHFQYSKCVVDDKGTFPLGP